jgi:hypothetical protein
MWFNIAALSKDLEARNKAIENRERAAGIMKPTQIKYASVMAKQCQKSEAVENIYHGKKY